MSRAYIAVVESFRRYHRNYASGKGKPHTSDDGLFPVELLLFLRLAMYLCNTLQPLLHIINRFAISQSPDFARRGAAISC